MFKLGGVHECTREHRPARIVTAAFGLGRIGFLRSTQWLEDTAQIPIARPHADWDDRTIPVR